MKVQVLNTVIFLSFLFLNLTAQAQSMSAHEEQVFNFAEYLEKTEDYYRAITEYKRFVFQWPDHPLAAECRFRIGRSYMNGSDYSQAVTIFQELFTGAYDYESQRKNALGLSRSYYLKKSYRHAGTVLLQIPIDQQSKYDLTWCYMQSHEPEKALSLWQNSQELNAEKISRSLLELEHISSKKPVLAGIMSAIIPGTGQIYSGRWRDGVVAFLVNGLFIAATAAAIDQDHYEAAALLGFFELGFYSANIYNAVNNTHKYNQTRWEQELMEFERHFGQPYNYGFLLGP